MQILYRFAGSIQQYSEELSDPDRYRPDHCPQCETHRPLRAHGFYTRTLVDISFEGTILQYLTLWGAGQPEPFVSTLNSFDGSVVANAAIVSAGSGGSVTAYVTDPTNLILDVNGFFAP